MIQAAQLAHQQRTVPLDGLENIQPQLSCSLAHQQNARVEELRDAKYQRILESNPALSLLKGYARFKNQNTLLVHKSDGSEEELVADRILIATGSTPSIRQLRV